MPLSDLARKYATNIFDEKAALLETALKERMAGLSKTFGDVAQANSTVRARMLGARTKLLPDLVKTMAETLVSSYEMDGQALDTAVLEEVIGEITAFAERWSHNLISQERRVASRYAALTGGADVGADARIAELERSMARQRSEAIAQVKRSVENKIFEGQLASRGQASKPAEIVPPKRGVFISHVTEEAALATKIKSMLHQAFGTDLKVFVSSDYVSIGSGEAWYTAILGGLKSASVVMVLLSRDSLERAWINFETGVGVGADTRVIPIVVRGLKRGGVGLPLGGIQARDLHDVKDVEAMLAEIGDAVHRKPAAVGVPSFVSECIELEARLPSRSMLLTPFLEWNGGVQYLRFRLENTGNREIELLQIEVVVPRQILMQTGPSPVFDPSLIEWEEQFVEGRPYWFYTHKVYDGPTHPSYGNNERLPRVFAPNMRPRDLQALMFSLKSDLPDAEKALSVRYKVCARGVNDEEHSMKLADIPVRAAK